MNLKIVASPVIVLIALLFYSPAQAQQRKAKPSAQPNKAPAKSQANFDQLKAQADEAREAGRLEDAIELYRKAIAAKPNWVDGWWYLSTLLYDRDRYAEAIPAFKRVTELQPRAGAPFVMHGL